MRLCGHVGPSQGVGEASVVNLTPWNKSDDECQSLTPKPAVWQFEQFILFLLKEHQCPYKVGIWPNYEYKPGLALKLNTRYKHILETLKHHYRLLHGLLLFWWEGGKSYLPYAIYDGVYSEVSALDTRNGSRQKSRQNGQCWLFSVKTPNTVLDIVPHYIWKQMIHWNIFFSK